MIQLDIIKIYLRDIMDKDLLLKYKKIYLDKNLQIVFGITLMAVMGVASITPAFPKILEELNITTQAIGMLIAVFTLPGIILTPILGIFADQYGRKKIENIIDFQFYIMFGKWAVYSLTVTYRHFIGIILGEFSLSYQI